MANDVSAQFMGQLHAYIGVELETRQKSPRDDMFTDLLQGEILDDDGQKRRLTFEEATMFSLLLASAGTETVARLIGWAGVVLAANRDQRAELVSDTALIPNTVEELLRFEAPSPVQGRWTTREIELHGQVIPPDSKVLLITGSAGRDERTFPDADRFDIHRKMDHHLSFGYGIHFCLGAALARLEGRIALEETLRRFPQWSVDLEQAVPLHTSTVRGYSKLPISV
jgi:cytochrome P450